jgi:hypothetical protein
MIQNLVGIHIISPNKRSSLLFVDPKIFFGLNMVFNTFIPPQTPKCAMVPVKDNGGGHSYYGLFP